MDITMEGLLLGLLAVAIGLAFCFYGFRVFLDPPAHLGLLRRLPTGSAGRHRALR